MNCSVADQAFEECVGRAEISACSGAESVVQALARIDSCGADMATTLFEGVVAYLDTPKERGGQREAMLLSVGAQVRCGSGSGPSTLSCTANPHGRSPGRTRAHTGCRSARRLQRT